MNKIEEKRKQHQEISEYFKYINEIDEYENLSEREKIFAKNVNKIVTQNNLTWKDLQRQETKLKDYK